MELVVPLDKVGPEEVDRFGSKAVSLAAVARAGIRVPRGVAIDAEAFRRYMDATGLQKRVLLLLERKPFDVMRWEELWDLALRIRNLFLRSPVPTDLGSDIIRPLMEIVGERPVAVRSSAPGEDSSNASFAGLHESYVNVAGEDAILEHIVRVWASLYSDRALLYRRELNLDAEHGAMAVVVQEVVPGERSGVAFGRSPIDPNQAVIEAVYGLNEGLVDGTVEPDRWIVQRSNGAVLSHHPVERNHRMVVSTRHTRLEAIPSHLRLIPPLTDTEVREVFNLVSQVEVLFAAPQDVEWCYRNGVLYTLQSRPITARSRDENDSRTWYLSLTRTFENLKQLKTHMETEVIPAMESQALRLARRDPAALSDVELADEIEHRERILRLWQDAYTRDCIPFAHAIRLFGRFYNDTVKPADPFEFMTLLSGSDLVAVARNRRLEELAEDVRSDSAIAEAIDKRDYDGLEPHFKRKLEGFVSDFQDLSWQDDRFIRDPMELLGFVKAIARSGIRSNSVMKDRSEIEDAFLGRFEGDERVRAKEMLDLARTGYRLRDDDNIYLGKIEGQVNAAYEHATNRVKNRQYTHGTLSDRSNVTAALRDPDRRVSGYPRNVNAKPQQEHSFVMRTRQLVGQPAGPGSVTATARVVKGYRELFRFQAGEVLVCDAVDPNMTFAVPIASAVVERRGGMLIHGAIIAREYGLPCVTGVPGATERIRTGDRVTVDGYLGIVILHTEDPVHQNGDIT